MVVVVVIVVIVVVVIVILVAAAVKIINWFDELDEVSIDLTWLTMWMLEIIYTWSIDEIQFRNLLSLNCIFSLEENNNQTTTVDPRRSMLHHS